MEQLNTLRYERAKKVTLWGLYTNVALSVFKSAIGVFGHSQALLADGIHSFSDVLTDILVLFASKAGSAAPDAEHPYGHARIETLAAMTLSFIIAVVGIGIIVDAVYHLLSHQSLPRPDVAVIVMAAISMVVNEVFYYATLRVGNEINSNLLRSNAWHHRSDALSSLIVLVAVIFAKLGFTRLDNLAAIIVAVLIIKMGITMAWGSIRELIDTGVASDLTKEIQQAIEKIEGVKSLHQLRTRSLGGAVFTDVHIQVDPFITVSEGHYIADKVYSQLKEGGLDISDVLVHVDSEDDQIGLLAEKLPDRQKVLQDLQAYFSDTTIFSQLIRMNIHYLNGKVIVELFLPINMIDSLELFKQPCQLVAEKINYISKVEVFFA
jgi:cation diffusion facilitator family transporter